MRHNTINKRKRQSRQHMWLTEGAYADDATVVAGSENDLQYKSEVWHKTLVKYKINNEGPTYKHTLERRTLEQVTKQDEEPEIE